MTVLWIYGNFQEGNQCLDPHNIRLSFGPLEIMRNKELMLFMMRQESMNEYEKIISGIALSNGEGDDINFELP